MKCKKSKPLHNHTHFGFRNPERYKEFENDKNVIVGYGELVHINTPNGDGWITPCKHIFYNKEDAVQYASHLNEMIKLTKKKQANDKLNKP